MPKQACIMRFCDHLCKSFTAQKLGFESTHNEVLANFTLITQQRFFEITHNKPYGAEHEQNSEMSHDRATIHNSWMGTDKL